MLKRNLTMLIAVGLLGANVNLAAAGEGAFPPATKDTLYLAAQGQHLKQREAANPSPAVTTGSPFPPSSEDSPHPLSAQAEFLEKRAAKTQAASAGVRTVKTTAATKYLNIEHEEIVKIENDKGQSFVWKADTLGEANLPLQAIAPRGFAAGQTRVFVRHPYEHLMKD